MCIRDRSKPLSYNAFAIAYISSVPQEDGCALSSNPLSNILSLIHIYDNAKYDSAGNMDAIDFSDAPEEFSIRLIEKH